MSSSPANERRLLGSLICCIPRSIGIGGNMPTNTSKEPWDCDGGVRCASFRPQVVGKAARRCGWQPRVYRPLTNDVLVCGNPSTLPQCHSNAVVS